MKKFKRPACTHLVLESLRTSDDFMNQGQLAATTGCNKNQVSAALHMLRRVRAVDVVVNPDGTGWWFALPPESDKRCRHLEEITPESKPRKLRKRKAQP